MYPNKQDSLTWILLSNVTCLNTGFQACRATVEIHKGNYLLVNQINNKKYPSNAIIPLYVDQWINIKINEKKKRQKQQQIIIIIIALYFYPKRPVCKFNDGFTPEEPR